MFVVLGTLFGLAACAISVLSIIFYRLVGSMADVKTETEFSTISLTILGGIIVVLASIRATKRVVGAGYSKSTSAECFSFSYRIRLALATLSFDENRFTSIRIVVVPQIVFIINIFTVLGAALDAKYSIGLLPSLDSIPPVLAICRSLLGVLSILAVSIHILSNPKMFCRDAIGLVND